MATTGCTRSNQFLYAVFERPSKVSEFPLQRTPGLVEGDSLSKVRQRFAERKLYPDGLESNGAEGGVARVDPAPMRTRLSAAAFEDFTCKKKTFFGFSPFVFFLLATHCKEKTNGTIKEKSKTSYQKSLLHKTFVITIIPQDLRRPLRGASLNVSLSG